MEYKPNHAAVKRDSGVGGEGASSSSKHNQIWRSTIHESRSAAQLARLAALLALGADAARDGKSDDQPPAPRIAGYEVTGFLGRGGMGTVWRAVQIGTRRAVALKLLAPESFASRNAQLRFAREVELAARLDHPHIARVYDSGVRQGAPFYAMELIDGTHLDRFVREKRLLKRQILMLMREICRAVEYAHQRGVIHRDLKPSNILVTRDGKPYVVDFGLAGMVNDADERRDRIVSTETLRAGTPAFMSPEQANGRWDLVDTRTDVYSLGATLRFQLSSEAPQNTPAQSSAKRRRNRDYEIRRPPAAKSSIDRGIERVLQKALAIDPQHRYACAGDLAIEIDNSLRGTSGCRRARRR